MTQHTQGFPWAQRSLLKPAYLLVSYQLVPCLLVPYLLLLSACQVDTRLAGETISVTDHQIASRGTMIPATLTQPALTTAMPLVVMLHGHGGSRHEAGGFTKIADGLAASGIASIRMDFPGCGDSTEPFRNQQLSTMLSDAGAARDWALANANIDTQRMALVGFSMGGRLAITLASRDSRFKTMALWAPSADPGATALHDFFGGQAAFESMRAIAAAEGFAPFTTSWGAKQELSNGWFNDMAGSKPLQLIKQFKGDLFVLYGAQDTVVTPAESERVISHATNARSAQSYTVANADHGLGLFSDEPHLTDEAVAQTVRFLSSRLTRATQ